MRHFQAQSFLTAQMAAEEKGDFLSNIVHWFCSFQFLSGVSSCFDTFIDILSIFIFYIFLYRFVLLLTS